MDKKELDYHSRKNVYFINPEQKDYDRANAMTKVTDASKMAKVITDLQKLIRRSKAVAAVWSVRQGGKLFDDMISPFVEALKNNGIKFEDIRDIKNFSNPASVQEPVRKQVNAVQPTKQDDFEDKVSDKW